VTWVRYRGLEEGTEIGRGCRGLEEVTEIGRECTGWNRLKR